MRLTNDIRERIVRAAMDKAGIFKEEEKVKSMYAEFAEKCRLSAVTPEVQNAIDQIRKLAKLDSSGVIDFKVNKSSYLYVNCNGKSRYFTFDGQQKRYYSEELSRICPRDVILKSGNPLLDDLAAADKAEELLEKRKDALEGTLKATLWSVTTDKKLYEIWPESKSFMPIIEGAPTVNFPALPIKELNKMIGLP